MEDFGILSYAAIHKVPEAWHQEDGTPLSIDEGDAHFVLSDAVYRSDADKPQETFHSIKLRFGVDSHGVGFMHGKPHVLQYLLHDGTLEIIVYNMDIPILPMAASQ